MQIQNLHLRGVGFMGPTTSGEPEAPVHPAEISHWDAGNTDSYSGADWNDLHGRYTLSPTSVTFSGPVGASGAYFTTDGSGYFGAPSKDAFVDSLHQTGVAFSIWLMIRTPTVIATGATDAYTLFSTYPGSGEGFIFEIRAGVLRVVFYTVGAIFFAGDVPLSAATDYQVGFVRNGASSFLTINDGYGSTGETFDLSPTSANPAGVPIHLWRRAAGRAQEAMPAGARLYRLKLFDAALTKAEMDAQWAENQARYIG